MAGAKFTKNCERCGKAFDYHLDRGLHRKYCSQQCYFSRTPEQRFESMIDKSGECWQWTGFIDPDGYGTIRVSNQSVRAYRFAYTLAHGPIPRGLLVRHSCHNRACVNPAHLRTGTNADNSADMVAADRQAKGEHNGSAVLTNDQVKAIRRDTRSMYVLAREYGVGGSTIQRIRKGTHWRHVQ